MSSHRFRWCKSGHGKKVYYNPRFYKDGKPYVCEVCGRRYSSDDIGYRSKNTDYPMTDRVRKLSKKLLKQGNSKRVISI